MKFDDKCSKLNEINISDERRVAGELEGPALKVFSTKPFVVVLKEEKVCEKNEIM